MFLNLEKKPSYTKELKTFQNGMFCFIDAWITDVLSVPWILIEFINTSVLEWNSYLRKTLSGATSDYMIWRRTYIPNERLGIGCKCESLLRVSMNYIGFSNWRCSFDIEKIFEMNDFFVFNFVHFFLKNLKQCQSNGCHCC